MRTTDEIRQGIETDIDTYTERALPPLQHQWLLPGQESLALKWAFSATQQPQTEQEKRRGSEAIRNAILAQLNSNMGTTSRDTQYLAYLLLKKGRGGEIVGNPYAIGYRQQELPYTGLEGYYAGSERTATRPGLTPGEILLEEANLGAELLKTMKKHYIEHNAWVEFAHLKHALDGERPDVEELKSVQGYFGMIIGRLHVRVYRNPEFALTLSEQIEQLKQLLSEATGKSNDEHHLQHDLQATYEKLKQDRERMSAVEREQERQERRRREHIRADRLAEFHNFRKETYHILATANQRRYVIGVRDTSPADLTITETITLPDVPGRNSYPPLYTQLTPGQVEGYLFLAKLGEIGGDPVVRSIYS